MYQYKNDCLVAAVEYNKNYYNDRDITPNEEFISITITPFASINSPSFNMIKKILISIIYYQIRLRHSGNQIY